MQAQTSVAAPQPTPPPLKEFNPLEWVRILCSQVGIGMHEVPEEIHKQMSQAQAKQQVNKLFFDWYNTRPVQTTEFTDEDRQLFKKAISIESSSHYQEIFNARQGQQREVTRLSNAITTCARNIAAYNEKLWAMRNQDGIDLTAEIEAIVKDGWFKYESGLTKNMNIGVEEPALYFTTPRVNMAFYNKAVGAEMNVDMGKYLIKYWIRTGRIEVKVHEDNLNVEHYIHPHVATDSSICWGNAAPHYSKSMVDHTPSLAFKSMRVILQTYNDESPYRSISEFALARNPRVFEDREVVFARCENNAWIYRRDLPNNYRHTDLIEEQENEDGYEEDDKMLMRVYERQYSGTGVRVSGYESVYVRVTNEDESVGYQAVDIDDWE